MQSQNPPLPFKLLNARGQNGSTLIQVCVVLAVLGVVSTFAIISFTNTRANLRLQNTTRQLAQYMEKARLDAIRDRMLVCRVAVRSRLFQQRTLERGSAGADCKVGRGGMAECTKGQRNNTRANPRRVRGLGALRRYGTRVERLEGAGCDRSLYFRSGVVCRARDSTERLLVLAERAGRVLHALRS